MKLHLKFDLHTHSRFSADGVSEPEDMVEEARKKKLSGFAITDHNTCACVDYFLQHGFMRTDGKPVDDFLIIPGQEISTSEGHLLALGVRLPDLKGIPPEEAISLVHQSGGIAVPAHPYDFFRSGIREALMDVLPIDAVEVFNAATTLKRYNRQAFEYAQRMKLPMVAGSDAHHARAIGTAYTILEPEEFTLEGVLASIKKAHRVEQRYLTAKETIKKTWSNIFRLKRKKKTHHKK
ncbi:MAG: PHP domain-containing protein [Verrucomicrobiota bacterium]